MKVVIGKYVSRWSTGSLEDFWYRARYGKDENRWSVEDSLTDKWDDRFEKLSDHIQTLLNATVNKVLDRRNRKIRVRIDYYDVWSADHTLALIILPTLKKLQEVKHGSPFVDATDVPENLRPTKLPGPDNGYTDDTVHERWDWVLDEMIWTFEQLVDDGGEDQFYDHADSNAYQLAHPDDFMGSIDKLKVDREGLDAHNKRIQRGTALFGKYYRSLWD